MNCPNCGGELDSRLICPYCGYEDTAAAGRRHKKEIAAIYIKIAQMLKIPVERARTLTLWLLRGALALVALFLAAVLIAFIYAKVSPDAAYTRQQESLETLEGYFQDGDYGAMNAELDSIDERHRAAYDKYTIVGGMYETLVSCESETPETAAFIAGFPDGADLLRYDLAELCGILRQCRTLAENGYVYGEEDAVAEISARAEALLKDTLLLSDEEIEAGIALAGLAEADYSPLYTAIAERLNGGAQ